MRLFRFSVRNFRTYRPLPNNLGYPKVLIGDASGTFVDKYSMAPVHAIRQVFEKFEIPISNSQARKYMGHDKRTHIKKILFEDNNVYEQWFKKYCKNPTETDVDNIFKEFIPIQTQILTQSPYCDLIPGVKESMKYIREEYGLYVGGTTGYSTTMLKPVLSLMEKQGFKPDVFVGADEVPHSRPYPDGIYLNLLKLRKLYPNDLICHNQIIKIGDTQQDIIEGLNAGVITIGLARYANYIGEIFENPEEFDKLEKNNNFVFDKILVMSYEHLAAVKPHFVMDTVKDLRYVISYIIQAANRS